MQSLMSMSCCFITNRYEWAEWALIILYGFICFIHILTCRKELLCACSVHCVKNCCVLSILLLLFFVCMHFLCNFVFTFPVGGSERKRRTRRGCDVRALVKFNEKNEREIEQMPICSKYEVSVPHRKNGRNGNDELNLTIVNHFLCDRNEKKSLSPDQ